MIRHFKSAALIAVFGLLITLVSGAATAQNFQQQIASSSVLEEIKKRGALRVGVGTFVPWSMRNDKGELVGFEIDVSTRIAKDMGVKADIIPTAWDGIIPSLLSGKFDTIISGMSMTSKRNMTVNFSIPYTTAAQGFVVNTKLAGNMSIEDFNDADVTIAGRRAAAGLSNVKKLWPKAKLRLFDDDAQAYQEVANGNAHGIMGPFPKPNFYVIQYKGALAQPFKDTEFLVRWQGFAVRKGDVDILNFFDNWIRRNGEFITARRDYWFNGDDWWESVAGSPSRPK